MNFFYKRKIFGFECDIYGHLNNANYLHLYEEARSEALEKIGLSLEKLLRENFIEIYLKKIEINFIKAIPFGETVSVITKINDITRVKSTWHQQIVNNENQAIYNKALIEGVFVKNNKPFRVGKEIIEIFSEFL